MKKSFAVLGLGRFGQSIAKTLYELGHEVLVIDESEEIIQAISGYVTHAIEGDCTDESVLSAVGVRNFDVAVVAIGQDIQSSILVTVMLKDMGVKYVVAKAQSMIHAKILSKVGADRVIFPERDMGIRVAHMLTDVNFVDFIELSEDYSIVEINCPQKWVGKTLRELDVRAKYGINIMAIKNGGDINVSPQSEQILSDGDILIMIGANKDLNKIE